MRHRGKSNLMITTLCGAAIGLGCVERNADAPVDEGQGEDGGGQSVDGSAGGGGQTSDRDAAGGSGGWVADAGWSDRGVVPDLGVLDLGPAAPDLGMSDAAPPDLGGRAQCPAACQRLVRCALGCPDTSPRDRRRLVAECAAACAGDPAFPAALLAAPDCEAAIDYALALGSPALEAACAAAPDTSCRFECQAGETCRRGRCVRDDGSCVTDYHCPLGEQQCYNGRCDAAQFAPCEDDGACREDLQRCEHFGQAEGYCVINCERDAQCPQHEACGDSGFCNYVYCGRQLDNGRINQICEVGDFGGVCVPLPRGDRRDPVDYGICVEGGGALEEGEPCDNQAQGRSEEARSLQCAPGLLCFGDTDDGEDPAQRFDSLGACTRLCNPNRPDCPMGKSCIDYSNGDDPDTPAYDETRTLGACQPVDCLLPEGACDGGRICRLYTVMSAEGHCEVPGEAPLFEPCATQEDCADTAICGFGGGDATTCLPLCNPDDEAPCGEGLICFSQPDWAWGACIEG